jgi:hypothetical protein
MQAVIDCKYGHAYSIPNDIKKSPSSLDDGLEKYPGDVLLSHDLSVIVSSALEDFTSVFGMGTGVTPPV